ncbi:hypothetical protein O181_072136 [Austropuccinia psidii MF-1]|uniref:Uncharacterized protein n=1 Tax=Austropuccinia psidii MF-1 TaxID=1389203 RepID=A0A9Q3I752_9BASI|nr:hypothetical protein [Austropuccinia psidii MF-1]
MWPGGLMLEGPSCDELDGEEVEVVCNSIGHQFRTSPSHPPVKRFQSHIIPSTPRTFQPVLSPIPTTLPPASPSSSTTRPALIPVVRLSPIPQSRNSPIVTSRQLQPVASSSRRREEISPFPFPAAQVFKQGEHWPIQVTREDPNMESENKDSVARLFRQVDENIREVIESLMIRLFLGLPLRKWLQIFPGMKMSESMISRERLSN